MKNFVKVMKALSDPNRVKILKMLQANEQCVCKLWVPLNLAQPTVSKHLKILEEAGLVQSRKVGPWVHYSLSADGSEYARTMLNHLKDWLDDDPEIARLREDATGSDVTPECGRRTPETVTPN